MPETVTYRAYGKEETVEQFQCNYGLNEEYRGQLSDGQLEVVGFDREKTTRIVELKNHRFFVATLFLPQLSSTPDKPHPLIMAFLKTTSAFNDLGV